MQCVIFFPLKSLMGLPPHMSLPPLARFWQRADHTPIGKASTNSSQGKIAKSLISNEKTEKLILTIRKSAGGAKHLLKPL
jgi:hypothetical protein